MPSWTGLLVVSLALMSMPARGDEAAVQLLGAVVDEATGKPLPARVYLQSETGEWFFCKSASPDGSAVEYRKERFGTSVEMHTTLSAHPFTAELPPGRYTVTVEHGKEYLPLEKTVEVRDPSLKVTFPLRRWIDMAKRGWYSGDTHVHRSIEELPNVMLAEDLNVALPLSYWVTKAYTPPGAGDDTSGTSLQPEPAYVDPTHVIYSVNTEYEIFSVGKKQHTLGAIFILGHNKVFEQGVPPVATMAEQARAQGALLDLDKHSWPWSLMLVPVMNVDLFELANNHVWRTQFGFRGWTTGMVPEYMKLERDERGFTEWGWIEFGFRTYYALLNCGFRMRPTAGTASGVHPVPLGFGRVYVELPGGFSYEKWMQGLDAGRSFVTTGPILMVRVDDRPAGATIASERGTTLQVRGTAHSARPLRSIEVVVNGDIAQRLTPKNSRTASGGYESAIKAEVDVDSSSWIAVRVFEDHPEGRVRFAHSSPVHVDIAGRPLRPRKEEVQYFVQRMHEEIERNRDVLGDEQLDEYRRALREYEKLAQQAR